MLRDLLTFLVTISKILSTCNKSNEAPKFRLISLKTKKQQYRNKYKSVITHQSEERETLNYFGNKHLKYQCHRSV